MSRWAVPIAAAALAVSAVPGGNHAAPAEAPELPKEMNPKVVAAIDTGLKYLAKMQQPNGSFPAKWDSRAYPAAMTSLAGLAFLASGSTPEEGPHAENVKKAMVYLLELGEAHPDGLITGPEEYRSTYGHGYSMLFLAQCYGMERDTRYEKRIKALLDKAVMVVARGQSPRGGWLYSPIRGGDEGSTTAAVLQGLRACRNAGIKVPRQTIDRAVGYLRFCQNPDGGICYSASNRGGSRPAIAAAAIACFYATGVYDRQAGGKGPEAIMVEKLWRYLKVATKNVEDIKGFYFYHNFYLAQGMYHRAGREWELYYRQISQDLLRRRAANGSWNGDNVGPVYATAIACVILQLPYGCLPICER